LSFNHSMTALTTTPPPSTREFALSVIAGEFQQAALNLPPDIALMSALEIENIRNPTEIDFLLRKRLWKQVEIAKKTGETHITNRSIFAGVCSEQNFFVVLKNPHRVAWLLTHPTEDLERMKYGLSLGMKNLVEFVSKTPNEKTAGAFLKAIELLMNRVHGPVVQKVEAKHAHMKVQSPISTATPEEVIARLDELKSKLLTTKDVTPSDDNDPT